MMKKQSDKNHIKIVDTADSIEKIEYSVYSDLVNELPQDKIGQLVNFLNSVAFTKLYPHIDCQRPGTTITIHYKGKRTEKILYNYTSLEYNGIRYETHRNSSDEFDRLLYPNFKRS